MVKIIKAEGVQSIPSHHIVYKTNRGTWVWRRPDIPENKNWPGQKAPKWANNVIFKDGKWCWTNES